jgi:hypothetical protein
VGVGEVRRASWLGMAAGGRAAPVSVDPP